MEDLIPILLQYIKSREKQGGYVLWIAHNGRAFDAPFLIHEFIRCSTELPLGRELIKSSGILLLSYSSNTNTCCLVWKSYLRICLHIGTNLSSASLVALQEFYEVKVDGSAHRARVDVNSLTQILPMLTPDLKLTSSENH